MTQRRHNTSIGFHTTNNGRQMMTLSKVGVLIR